MTEKIINVKDAGPGDGGKGTTVHKIATVVKPHTIIKEGGGQGSHGVSTSRGEQFAFSHWGCGTFEGVRTHLSPRMIIFPEGLLYEAEMLEYQFGIRNIFGLLTVDRRVLCATPYHGIASRLKELARGSNPRGTIGTGVGEAYRHSERLPGLAIRACNLGKSDIKNKLAAIRDVVRQDIAMIYKGDYLPADRAEAAMENDLLYDDSFLDYIVEKFKMASKQIKIVDEDYLGREILSQDGVAVVESSHGILTDHFQGFHPHTSAIRTLPCFTHKMLREAGYTGQIVDILVRRAYEIRHGAGPMPTSDPEITDKLLPGSHKEENRYQGKIRVGPLDLVLFRYAIEVCGGPDSFSGLAITWFDQIQCNGVWSICDRYQGALDQNYFTPEGKIKIWHGTDAEQLEYQEKLGKQLLDCQPEITTFDVSKMVRREDLYSLCADVLKEKLGIPVRMISFGPTEKDKILK